MNHLLVIFLKNILILEMRKFIVFYPAGIYKQILELRHIGSLVKKISK